MRNRIALAAGIAGWTAAAGIVAGLALAPGPETEHLRARVANLEHELAEAEALNAIDPGQLLEALAAESHRLADLLAVEHALHRVGLEDGQDLMSAFSAMQGNAAAVALLKRASARIGVLEAERASLVEQLGTGLVAFREITVTEANTAHPLLPPKLMMSVSDLSAGLVRVQAGRNRAVMAVGERMDIVSDDGCRCYLVLTEAGRSLARFTFGCERPGAAETVQASPAIPTQTARF